MSKIKIIKVRRERILFEQDKELCIPPLSPHKTYIFHRTKTKTKGKAVAEYMGGTFPISA